MKRWILVLAWSLSACVSTATQRDLYSDAQSARGTADAAMQQAQFQERFLTASAEAPIVHITETAAALIVEAAHAEGTSVAGVKTQSAISTQTAISWTPTPNATGTLGAVQLAAIQTQTNLDLVKQENQNQIESYIPTLSFAVVLLSIAILYVWISRRERYRPMQVDDRGNVLPVMDVVDGKVTDVDRNPNYHGLLSNNIFNRWLEQKLLLPPTVPTVTAERQDATTQRDQLIDMTSRGLPGGQKSEGKKQELMKQLPAPAQNLESRFKLIEDTSTVEVIDGEIIQVLDQEWKENEQQ